MRLQFLVLCIALVTNACGRIDFESVTPEKLHRGDLLRFTLTEQSLIEDVRIDGHPVYAVRELQNYDEDKPYAFEVRIPNEVSNGKAYLSARIQGVRQERKIEILPSEHPTFRAISVADGIGCALDDAKHVWCWDRFDELGFPTPVRVSREQVEQVVAGQHYYCTLAPNGAVNCFGDGHPPDQTPPCCYSEIIPSADAGEYIEFGRTTKGELLVLDSEMVWSRQALPFTGRAYAANDDTACGIDESNEISCWGKNDYGQLGNGTTVSTVVPTPISEQGPWSTVANAGATLCALKAGIPWCWGAMDVEGPLNEVKMSFSSVPFALETAQIGTDQVPTPAFSMLRASQDVFCGIAVGSVWCWGPNSIYGWPFMRLARSIPLRVDATDDWIEVDPSPNQVCALNRQGQIWCWSIENSWTFSKPEQITVK